MRNSAVVPEMTYKVSSGTLNLCSISQSADEDSQAELTVNVLQKASMQSQICIFHIAGRNVRKCLVCKVTCSV